MSITDFVTGIIDISMYKGEYYVVLDVSGKRILFDRIEIDDRGMCLVIHGYNKEGGADCEKG